MSALPSTARRTGQRKLALLLDAVRSCRACEAHLPLGPRPVLQAHVGARILIVGQAPSLRVHESGVPWNDASGTRLRAWMGLAPSRFYDPTCVALVPMGFCYPGRGSGGDLPPRPECAPAWHDRLLTQLPERRLTLLVGRYAQRRFLGERPRSSLTETVESWRSYLPGCLPLPHPSPRNQLWLRRHPWFEAELVPALREAVRRALED